MTKRSITMKGKNSFVDFGWYITDFKQPPPQKRKLLEMVPHMSGSHDFSEVSGSAVYDDREIEVTFRREIRRDQNTEVTAEFIQWLYEPYGDTIRYAIQDSQVSGWKYWGECVKAVPTATNLTGIVTATFLCDPFRMGPEQTEAIVIDATGKGWALIENTNLAAIPVELGFGFGGGYVWIKPYGTDTDTLWDGLSDYEQTIMQGTVMVPPGKQYIAVQHFQAYEDNATLTWTERKV